MVACTALQHQLRLSHDALPQWLTGTVGGGQQCPIGNKKKISNEKFAAKISSEMEPNSWTLEAIQQKKGCSKF